MFLPEAREVISLAPTSGSAARLTRRQICAALERAGRTRLLDAETERLYALFRVDVLRNPPMVEDVLGREVGATVRLLSEACASADELAEAAGKLFVQHPQFPECRAYYDRRRAAGDRHTAALRRLFARLLSSLHHCLRHGEEFDASAWPRASEPQTG